VVPAMKYPNEVSGTSYEIPERSEWYQLQATSYELRAMKYPNEVSGTSYEIPEGKAECYQLRSTRSEASGMSYEIPEGKAKWYQLNPNCFDLFPRNKSTSLMRFAVPPKGEGILIIKTINSLQKPPHPKDQNLC